MNLPCLALPTVTSQDTLHSNVGVLGVHPWRALYFQCHGINQIHLECNLRRIKWQTHKTVILHYCSASPKSHRVDCVPQVSRSLFYFWWRWIYLFNVKLLNSWSSKKQKVIFKRGIHLVIIVSQQNIIKQMWTLYLWHWHKHDMEEPIFETRCSEKQYLFGMAQTILIRFLFLLFPLHEAITTTAFFFYSSLHHCPPLSISLTLFSFFSSCLTTYESPLLLLPCSPFYGEDFYCEIPRSFRHLSFYIFDRDVFRRDSSIGEDVGNFHHKLFQTRKYPLFVQWMLLTGKIHRFNCTMFKNRQ